MEIKEINELTRNWTADEFADFLHYLLQHGDHESMRGWWRSTSLLRKLEAAGLAELDGGEVALTPSGIKLRDALYLLEESDGLADARLNLRVHRLEDRHAAPLGADTLMLLVAGRSGRVRFDAARMLMEDVDGGRKYADRLAKCWDPKVRIFAAPYTDPHLFWTRRIRRRRRRHQRRTRRRRVPRTVDLAGRAVRDPPRGWSPRHGRGADRPHARRHGA